VKTWISDQTLSNVSLQLTGDRCEELLVAAALVPILSNPHLPR
jgi:hypothetical protein